MAPRPCLLLPLLLVARCRFAVSATPPTPEPRAACKTDARFLLRFDAFDDAVRVACAERTQMEGRARAFYADASLWSKALGVSGESIRAAVHVESGFVERRPLSRDECLSALKNAPTRDSAERSRVGGSPASPATVEQLGTPSCFAANDFRGCILVLVESVAEADMNTRVLQALGRENTFALPGTRLLSSSESSNQEDLALEPPHETSRQLRFEHTYPTTNWSGVVFNPVLLGRPEEVELPRVPGRPHNAKRIYFPECLATSAIQGPCYASSTCPTPSPRPSPPRRPLPSPPPSPPPIPPWPQPTKWPQPDSAMRSRVVQISTYSELRHYLHRRWHGPAVIEIMNDIRWPTPHFPPPPPPLPPSPPPPPPATSPNATPSRPAPPRWMTLAPPPPPPYPPFAPTPSAPPSSPPPPERPPLWYDAAGTYPRIERPSSASERVDPTVISLTRSVHIVGKCKSGRCVLDLDRKHLHDIPGRHFRIDSGNYAVEMRFENLEFRGGLARKWPRAAGGGNADEQDGGSMIIENKQGVSMTRFLRCSFVSNVADRFGGAMLIRDANTVEFDSCTFDKNRAYSGGAVYVSSRANATFRDCSFKDNQASPSAYHAKLSANIHVRDHGSMVHLVSSTFSPESNGTRDVHDGVLAVGGGIARFDMPESLPQDARRHHVEKIWDLVHKADSSISIALHLIEALAILCAPCCVLLVGMRRRMGLRTQSGNGYNNNKDDALDDLEMAKMRTQSIAMHAAENGAIDRGKRGSYHNPLMFSKDGKDGATHSLNVDAFFRRLDVNGDHELDVHEVTLGLRLLGLKEDEMHGVIRAADRNGDGRISLSEMRRSLEQHPKALRFLAQRVDEDGIIIRKIDVEKFFAQLDVDGNGILSSYEMKRALQLLGMENISVDYVMAGCDTNGDGQLSLREFMVGLENHPKARDHIERVLSRKFAS